MQALPPASSKFTLQAPLLATLLVSLAIGCASPGPPRPPSLKLPQPVADLTAQRVGNQVLLHWTTPSKTTDNLNINGALSAHICRAGVPPASSAQISTPSRLPLGAPPPKNPNPPPAAPCTIVLTIATRPGPATTVETLPVNLTSDPILLLDYRVEILNSANRSAGLSNSALSVAGSAPPPITNLRATATATGVILQWAALNPPLLTTVQLDRLDQTLAVSRQLRSDASANTSQPPLNLANRESPEVHLIARAAASQPAATEPPGTLDTTARFGDIYRYTAQRIRTVTLSGHSFELRSAPSDPITLALHDTFPPAIPVGLATVPGQTQTTALAPSFAIDLSWEPNTEPDLAGYNVYRRDTSSSAPPTRLNPTPIPGPAFRDAAVDPGHTYAYSITSVDISNNESKPTPEIQQTLPQP